MDQNLLTDSQSTKWSLWFTLKISRAPILILIIAKTKLSLENKRCDFSAIKFYNYIESDLLF